MCFLLCFHREGPWTWPLLPHKGDCSFLRLPREHMKTNSCFTNIFPAFFFPIESPFSSWPHLRMNCLCSLCGFYLACTTPVNTPPHPPPLFAAEFVLLFCHDSSKEPPNIWARHSGTWMRGNWERAAGEQVVLAPGRKWEFHFDFAGTIFDDLILSYGFLG